jgi:hypothetical protein
LGASANRSGVFADFAVFATARPNGCGASCRPVQWRIGERRISPSVGSNYATGAAKA